MVDSECAYVTGGLVSDLAYVSTVGQPQGGHVFAYLYVFTYVYIYCVCFLLYMYAVLLCQLLVHATTSYPL